MNIHDAIEQAYKRGYEAGQPKWIPVTERFPTEDDADDNGFVFAYTTENKKIIARWTDVCRFSEFVTHWMPLPQPPKEG